MKKLILALILVICAVGVAQAQSVEIQIRASGMSTTSRFQLIDTCSPSKTRT